MTGAVLAAAVVIPLWHPIVADRAALTRALLVVALAAVYIVGQRGVESLRLAASAAGPRQDMMAIWTVLAALVLPPTHMALAIAGVYALYLPQLRGIAPRRVAIAVATTMLASEAGGWVHHHVHHGTASVVVAAAAIILAQPVLVAVTMLAAGQSSLIRSWFLSWSAWATSLATASVGVLFAVCLVGRLWVVVVPLMAATWVLYCLAQHLQVTHEHAIDPTTGLPTEAMWRRLIAQLPPSETWTIATLRPVDPAKLASAAQVLQMLCDHHDIAGRFGDGIALAIKTSPVVTRNLLDRARSDLAAIGIDVETSYGRGGTPAEQLAAINHASEMPAIEHLDW